MLRLRSCASSMMIVSYASSHGSDCVSASRMPSVMNLISDCVGDLIGEAHLETDEIADLRAELARRRGARPRAPRCAAAACSRSGPPRRDRRRGRASGSCVVLPEPVSPASTTTWCSRIRRDDVVGLRGDRQRFVERDLRDSRGARGALRGRCLDVGGERIDLGRRRLRTRGRKPAPARQEAAEVARHDMVQRGAESLQVRHRGQLSRRALGSPRG